MAAHGYYDSGYGNHPPTYDQTYPPIDPFSRRSPAPEYSGASVNPYTAPDSDPNHLRYSQQSLSSDQGPYVAGGRLNDHDQYAENIPLKENNQYTNGPPPAGWMHQPTQYPPPEMIEPPAGRAGRKKKRMGMFKKKIPWVTYLLTLVQVVVFIVELVKSAQLTGSPIQTKPQINPMIGPSAYLQISMGSRYTPCMKNVNLVQNSPIEFKMPCPNTTTNEVQCTLSELCGFSGVPNPKLNGSLEDEPQPNQWYRFIIPMFLHSGFVHIGFNLLVQMTMGVDMERMIGWWRYSLVYVASGIWGFVLGGNYSAPFMSSCGCSGALFGILALFVLDLLYTWNERQSPWVELIVMVLGVAVSFVLGLLPGLDNFSHIGGFVMGLALGLCIMRSPNALRERIGLARNPYVAMSGGAGSVPAGENKPTASGTSFATFFKGKQSGSSSEHFSPLHFFKGRKPLWWGWWLVRAGALVAVLIGFIFLIVDFYKYHSSTCSWCNRLSCLPVNGWCEQGMKPFEIKNTTTTHNN
ncbi:hypothetical protein EYZ11_000531 [Aspergillus tanneri]|uniref:Rhomboid-type serine protease n=1 Tax=Aspergillus tanneri TaxID=1220188 RepID=A0A4S3JWT8_9EURO|nr:uncharacterized protein ATNIH1004_004076 [Aspergillus tanneri]KAA8648193.1 hypothetical protein ATNIH1004_004076 [Aspergillus tanneri]THC99952.1 hypothetical protein EYZ11_000531 [Aspergillus tanneri]